MSVVRSLIRPLALLGLGFFASQAPASAASLSELFSATPAPPADVTVAAGWAPGGTVTAPEITGFQARLKAEKDAIAAAQAQAAARMSVPPDQDSPAVLTAVNAYKVYSADNAGDKEPAQVVGKRAAWLLGRYTKSANPNWGTVIKQQQSAAELDAYRGLYKDWVSKRSGVVGRAEGQLAGAGDLGAIKSGANLQAVAQYRLAMVAEIEALLAVTEQAARRAAQTQALIQPAS